MTFLTFKTTFLIAACAFSISATAKNNPKKQTAKAAPAPHYAESAEAMRFADDLAERRGLDREWVRQAIGQARLLREVPRLVLPPPKGQPKNWAAYRARFVEPVRIRAGLRFWQDNAEALVNAALARLRTGGYTYTLEPGVYGQHTADEFWFDRKEGFCEHIASAFVVLMRAMDVPARIVTGYQGGDRNTVDGYWTVRQSDAHAWAEVWMAGRGWVRVDPTSAVAPGRTGAFERLQAPRGALATAMGTVMSPGMAQNLRAMWEAVNNGWNQWVLNYTQSRQLDLLKALGFESPSWQDLTTVLGALVGLAALGGAGWTLWERSQHDPWLRLLARARQRLAKSGLTLPDTLPPRAMAERVQAQFGDSAQGVANWLLRLEQLRYAAHPAHQLGALRREFRTLSWPAAPARR